MAHDCTFDAPKGFPNNSLRGPRGPGRLGIDYATELENRMPIKQDKLEKMEKFGRRESRLGLRNIFGRTKGPRDGHDLGSVYHARPHAIDSYDVEYNGSPHNYPYDEGTQPSFSWQPAPPLIDNREPEIHPSINQESAIRKKRPSSRPGRQPKENPTNWSMPPLFKAFPQAIMQATLPAVTTSAENILRMNEKKGNAQDSEATENDLNSFHDDGLDSRDRISRKKTKKTGGLAIQDSDWTTKVFILATSGCLLQYSGDGTYDRLPEKVLRLGPASAAFATDAIPGRHWVIQVSSVAETDESAGPVESRSIFSKLSFRLAERRSAANLLMVFESAHDMESWMRVLRNEIEKQGGKRNLSETGKPKNGENERRLKEQTSQRTLVVRDPSRFPSTHGRPRRPSFKQEENPPDSAYASRITSSDTTGNLSLDDISTTDSVVSHDEHQLNSLRENSHRFSLISSGQRTIVTSTGSSPDSSPTADQFKTQSNDTWSCPSENVDRGVRARPNAAEIASRRESMQQIHTFVDDFEELKTRSHVRPTGVTIIQGEGVVVSPIGVTRPTPNFSVPKSSSRRFSYSQSTSVNGDTSPPRNIQTADRPPRSSSRMALTRPPTALSAHRLSAVTAQQAVLCGPGITTNYEERERYGQQLIPQAPVLEPQLGSVSRGRMAQRLDGPLPAPPSPSQERLREQAQQRLAARQYRSTSALRRERSPLPLPKEANRAPHIASLLAQDAPTQSNQPSQAAPSALNVHEGFSRERPAETPRSAKRASMGSVLSSHEVPDIMLGNGNLKGFNPPKDNGNNFLATEKTQAKATLMNRRSMPHMVVSGPPPAPPPTRALPPIPQKFRVEA